MAPNSSTITEQQDVRGETREEIEFKPKIIWINVFGLLLLHLTSLYGIYLVFTSAAFKTYIFSLVYMYVSALGVSAGYHRLWSHRSFKAKWPLRALLCVLVSMAAQRDIFEWCRDHRVHHKYSGTNADPHNINRGFFFAHIGWLMSKKHPAVIEKGKTIPLDDLLEDPIVRFHRRFYIPMVLLFTFYLPTMIPVWWWNETVWNSFFICALLRYCTMLEISFLVNSAAHYYGDKPFDKYIEARENALVAFLAVGEGWHNYHHVFPWDYSTSELGYTLNLTKVFIDFMAFLGLAYDLKTVSPEMAKRKKLKVGDGTRE